MNRAHRDERGVVTVFVLVLSVALILAAGLVIDGGDLLAARREAIAAADSAARAGAQALDAQALNTSGATQLDPAQADAAAQDALRAGGYQGSVAVTGTRITVTVHINQPLYVLGLAGLGSKTVTGASTARAVRGVTGPDQ